MLTRDELIDIFALIDTLGVRWETLRDAGKMEEAATVLEHYQGLIRYLLSTGYKDYLPPDTELPEEYMPFEYMEMKKDIVVEIPK